MLLPELCTLRFDWIYGVAVLVKILQLLRYVTLIILAEFHTDHIFRAKDHDEVHSSLHFLRLWLFRRI